MASYSQYGSSSSSAQPSLPPPTQSYASGGSGYSRFSSNAYSASSAPPMPSYQGSAAPMSNGGARDYDSSSRRYVYAFHLLYSICGGYFCCYR